MPIAFAWLAIHSTNISIWTDLLRTRYSSRVGKSFSWWLRLAGVGLVLTIGCSGEMKGSNFRLPASGAGGTGAAAETGAGPSGAQTPGAPGDRANGGRDPAADPAARPSACAQRSLPDQPLRRLSSAQYHNTLRDLFGDALLS